MYALRIHFEKFVKPGVLINLFRTIIIHLWYFGVLKIVLDQYLNIEEVSINAYLVSTRVTMRIVCEY